MSAQPADMRMAVLLLVCASRALDFLLRMGIVPFFPELAGRFGTSYAAVGGLYSAFFVGYALLQIPCGWAADRLPARRLIAGGLAGLGAGALLFNASARLDVALAARFLMGAAVAAVSVPGIRLVSVTFPAHRRGRAISAVEAVIGGSNLLALAGFPLLARWVSLETLTAALAAACFPLAAAFALSRAGAATPPADAARPAFLTRSDARQVLALLSLGFLGLCAMNGFMGWVPTYLRDGLGYTRDAAAWVMALTMSIYLPATFAAGLVSDRIGRRLPVIDAGSALMLAAFLLLTLGSGPAGILAAAAVFGLGGGWNMAPLLAFSTEALGPSRAGLAASLLQMAAQAGAAIAGVLFGAVVDASGDFTMVWWLGAALLALRIAGGRLAREQPMAQEPPRVPARSLR